MNWLEWSQAYWTRLKSAWSIASSGLDSLELEKALRSPVNQLMADRGSVERIGLHKRPMDRAREAGGFGVRKPWGVTYEILRTFARKNWALRACIAVRQREVAGANWRIVPNLEHHKKELDMLEQLVIAANRIEERAADLERYKPLWLPAKIVRALLAATVGTDLTEGELRYRFRLAYLDLLLEAERVAEKPRRLLLHPNGTRRTWDDMLRPLVEDLYSIGLGAWELRRAAGADGTSSPASEIKELHWLDSATLRPVITEFGDYAGDIDPDAVSWEQWIDDQRVGPGFRSCDIMPVLEHPQSDVMFRGYPYSRTETLLNTLELDARGDIATLKKFKRETYGKMLHLKGIPGLNTQEDVDAYRAYYEAELEGSYQLPIMASGKDGEIKGVDLSMNPGGGDKWSVQLQKQFMVRVCAVLDVPPFKIGITDDVNRATAFASAEEADTGLDAILRVIETTITRCIVQDFGSDLVKCVAERGGADEAETLEQIQKQLELHLLTVNEARLERGKAPVEDGDKPLNYRKTFYDEKARSDAQPDMGDQPDMDDQPGMVDLAQAGASDQAGGGEDLPGEDPGDLSPSAIPEELKPEGFDLN